MTHKAIEELYKIIKLEDWSVFFPEKRRKELLDAWVKKWVVLEEVSQSVINKDYLTSEYSDIIKTKLAQDMAEHLAEDCTLYKTEDTKITAAMVAIRRKAK